MSGINFNGRSFRAFNPNGVGGSGPIPEGDKNNVPKNYLPKETPKFEGLERFKLPDWQKRW